MFGIIGILTALFAGFMAESFVQPDASQDDSENTDESADETTNAANLYGYFLGAANDTDAIDTGPDDSDAIDTGPIDVGPIGIGPIGIGANGSDEGMPQSNDLPIQLDLAVTLTGGSAVDILFGDNAADLIIGSAGDDNLGGRGGDDTLLGGFDEDYLVGGDGNDLLDGGTDADTLFGDDGLDTLIGGLGNDMLYAGVGDDNILADLGDDSLFGGLGDDVLVGGIGNDALDGGLGDDTLLGGAGSDEVFGDAGNDTIWGGDTLLGDAATDFLNGGAGDDVLMLGAGDLAFGDAGADAFTITDFGAGSNAVQIGDFDTGEDHLVLLYETGLAVPLPSLQLDGSGNTQVLMDGQVVATLSNGSTIGLSDIILRADVLGNGVVSDVLMLGAGDVAQGHAGADIFTLTDPVISGTAVQITDFNPAEDQLVLTYEVGQPAPLPTLQVDVAGNTQILLDGQVVATVTSGTAINLTNIVMRVF